MQTNQNWVSPVWTRLVVGALTALGIARWSIYAAFPADRSAWNLFFSVANSLVVVAMIVVFRRRGVI
jgi:hypothetical protein